MNSPHPYAKAADQLTHAITALEDTKTAHARAYQGRGSDTTTAAAIRATIRSLHAYLDEVSQPRHDADEEQAETAHAAAARRYEEAKRAHEAAEEEANKACRARDTAAQAAAKTETAANKAEQTLRSAAYATREAYAELLRHQTARDTAREEAT